MSTDNQENFDQESQRRSYTKPHSGRHPIPTIQGYREHRKNLQDQLQETEEAQEGPEDESRPKRAYDSVKKIFKGEDSPDNPHQPYPATNRHYTVPPDQRPGDEAATAGNVDGQGVDARQYDDATSTTSQQQNANGAQQQQQQQQQQEQEQQQQQQQQQDSSKNDGKQQPQEKSATEHAAATADPKEKRKLMKKAKRQTGGREVTDPVTHLPIVIHDQTDKDLRSAPENEPEPGEHHTSATGPQGANKSEEELQRETEMAQRGFNGMQRLFPPPKFQSLKEELAAAYQSTVRTGLTVIGVVAASPFLFSSLQGRLVPAFSTILGMLGFLSITLGTAWGMGQWISKKVNEIVDDETWDASRREEEAILESDTELPESVQWLNSFLASIWPLINPDLFSSLIDTIEDVMQASLPKVVKMVSIDDMGQGNQSLRILGVKWLPTGAAGRSVGPGGKLEDKDNGQHSDRTDPEKGQAQETDKDTQGNEQDNGDESGDKKDKKTKQQEQEEVAIREGMEAEEGDYVNLELALAYRSRASGKSMKNKAKNAHLLLKFYSVGGVALPVWVEVRGFIATLRLRLQLTVSTPTQITGHRSLDTDINVPLAGSSIRQSLHTHLSWATTGIYCMHSAV